LTDFLFKKFDYYRELRVGNFPKPFMYLILESALNSNYYPVSRLGDANVK